MKEVYLAWIGVLKGMEGPSSKGFHQSIRTILPSTEGVKVLADQYSMLQFEACPNRMHKRLIHAAHSKARSFT